MSFTQLCFTVSLRKEKNKKQQQQNPTTNTLLIKLTWRIVVSVRSCISSNSDKLLTISQTLLYNITITLCLWVEHLARFAFELKRPPKEIRNISINFSVFQLCQILERWLFSQKKKKLSKELREWNCLQKKEYLAAEERVFSSSSWNFKWHSIFMIVLNYGSIMIISTSENMYMTTKCFNFYDLIFIKLNNFIKIMTTKWLVYPHRNNVQKTNFGLISQ